MSSFKLVYCATFTLVIMKVKELSAKEEIGLIKIFSLP